MLSSFSAQSLNNYEHFSNLGVEIALSNRHVENHFKDKTNTAIHSLGEDLTATPGQTESECACVMFLALSGVTNILTRKHKDHTTLSQLDMTKVVVTNNRGYLRNNEIYLKSVIDRNDVVQ